MSRKRSQDEADLLPIRTRSNSKRSRISPITDAHSDSSIPSTCSISEASALQSSDPASSDDTQQSSLTSSSDDDEDDEAISSSASNESSSSEESESESEADELEEEAEQEEIPTIGGPRKPQINHKLLREEADKLRRKLQEFMPKLRQANSELATNGFALNMEDVADEDEQHIEMSLGLGVLEEQRDSADDDDADDDEDDQQREEVMQTLMGIKGSEQQPQQRKRNVQEVDGT